MSHVTIDPGLPPTVLHAELILLGRAIRDGASALAEIGTLAPAQFADPSLGRIWSAINALASDGSPHDHTSMAALYAGTGTLDEVGGTAFLADLVLNADSSISNSQAADAVRDAWFKRRLIDLGESLVGIAFGKGGLSGFETLALAEQRLADLRAGAGR